MRLLLALVLGLGCPPCLAGHSRVAAGPEVQVVAPQTGGLSGVSRSLSAPALTLSPSSLVAPSLSQPVSLAPAPGLTPNVPVTVLQGAAAPLGPMLLAAPEQKAQEEQPGQSGGEEGSAKAAALFDGSLSKPAAAADLPEVSALPAPQTPKAGLLKRFAARLWPKVVEPRFDAGAPGYYHGTSFENLKGIVESGGGMKQTLSYYADEASFPRGYARSMARKTGSPGFVLQFPKAALEDKLVLGHYQPVPVSDRGPINLPKDYPKYFMAVKDVPLSDMTEGSKQTVLGWLAAQRDAYPEDPAWPVLVSRFEAALKAKAPAQSPEAAAKAERLAQYQNFTAQDHWGKVRGGFAAELAKVRALGSKDQTQAYVREEASKVLERIQEAHGTANVGFHYNLHGGQARQYVEAGLIRASVGDIALQYTMHGDPNHKVYFFQSSQHDLYEVLDARNPQPFIGRMGTVLILFRRDSPNLAKAESAGLAGRPSSISLDFDQARMPGIPYEDFLAPPLDVFNGVAKKVGQKRLSRDEETLAVLRYIEAAVLDFESRPPR
ncbi:MAG: hypothetical protein NTY77_07645 [Elusimicrobia bacterium]|nr:hypothetical protein [Elusimicrobiota bacterium]